MGGNASKHRVPDVYEPPEEVFFPKSYDVSCSPSAPSYESICRPRPTLGALLRETTEISRRETKIRTEKEIRDYFESLTFFVDMDQGIDNLCEFLFLSAKNGKNEVSLKRFYNVSNHNISKSSIELCFTDISVVWSHVQKQWDTLGCKAFTNWILENMQTFVETMKATHKFSIDLKVESTYFTMTMQW